jgi:tRNA-2-methylthio-N6-dimethylallyladenosine synthase
VPFQAGSDEILRRMNRGYTKEKYLQLVRLIRQYVPEAAITTDIIVGFPGETEADFEETLDVVRQVGFTSAFTFIYSKRSGTPAAKMEEQVPLTVKKERLNRLMELQNATSLRCHEQLVGKTLEVLAEGPSKQTDIWTGRTRTGVLVLWPVGEREYKPGEKVEVRITTAQTWLVKGEAC